MNKNRIVENGLNFVANTSLVLAAVGLFGLINMAHAPAELQQMVTNVWCGVTSVALLSNGVKAAVNFFKQS